MNNKVRGETKMTTPFLASTVYASHIINSYPVHMRYLIYQRIDGCRNDVQMDLLFHQTRNIKPVFWIVVIS